VLKVRSGPVSVQAELAVEAEGDTATAHVRLALCCFFFTASCVSLCCSVFLCGGLLAACFLWLCASVTGCAWLWLQVPLPPALLRQLGSEGKACGTLWLEVACGTWLSASRPLLVCATA
jgi:hypothetical protein